MPAIYAHYIFGEKMKRAFSPEIRALIRKNPDLFEIGLHGPDILFYYRALQKNKVNQTGFGMHSQPAGRFFARSASVIRNTENENDKDARIAYILGFLCHFALDLSCHSYIEQKIRVSHVSHSLIESEFDRYLLLRNRKIPLHAEVTGHLFVTPEYASQIHSFFPALSAEEIESSLHSMIWYNDLLTTPNPFKRTGIALVLRISGKYKSMRGLMMNKKGDPRCRDSNLRLHKLMNHAIDICLDLTDNYVCCLSAPSSLDPLFDRTFGPRPGWKEIPVLSYEKEKTYEIPDDFA